MIFYPAVLYFADFFLFLFFDLPAHHSALLV